MLGEQLCVQERKLDGVGDLFDLRVEATDIGVGDVGHLLQQQVFHLRPWQLLEQEVAARVEAHGVAAAQVHAAQRISELAHTLLVGAAGDECPNTVVEQFLDGDHFAGDLGAAGMHHVEALVEHDLGAALQVVVLDLGMQPDTHLAPAGEHVDRAVVVLAHDHAVRRRRLGELLDLVAQRRDVLPCFSQGVAELLVLRDGVGQLALGLQQSLLQGALALGGIGELAAELFDLSLEHDQLRLQHGHRLVGLTIGHLRNLTPPKRPLPAFANHHAGESMAAENAFRMNAAGMLSDV